MRYFGVADATAKDFKPGDLRMCGAAKCVVITEREATKGFASLIYTGGPPKRAAAPQLGVRYFELRFKNGYVPGIVAAARLDRFLSHGLVLSRFRRGTWYRVPVAAARKLRALGAGLRPLRLTRAAVAKSR
ncbi:MAG: hypothetical protein ABR583_00355 [Gaiellaceae bacterium]